MKLCILNEIVNKLSILILKRLFHFSRGEQRTARVKLIELINTLVIPAVPMKRAKVLLNWKADQLTIQLRRLIRRPP